MGVVMQDSNSRHTRPRPSADANEKALRRRQEELEAQLIAAPSTTWLEAAENARYLLGLLASTPVAQADLSSLLSGHTHGGDQV
jgi:hypothetical protein